MDTRVTEAQLASEVQKQHTAMISISLGLISEILTFDISGQACRTALCR